MKKLILAIFLLFGTLGLCVENGINVEYYNGNDCPDGKKDTIYTRLDNINLVPQNGKPHNSINNKNWSARFTGYLYVPKDRDNIFLEICNSAEAKSKWSRVVLNSNQKECRKSQPQGANKATQVSHGLHKIEAYYNVGVLSGTASRCMKLHWGNNKNGEIIGKEYFFPKKVVIAEFDKKEYKFIKTNGKQKIKVNLTSPLNQDLEINIQANGGNDFRIENNSVKIPKNSTSVEIPITILNNTSWTNDEKSFLVKLKPISANDFTDSSGEKVEIAIMPEFSETMITISDFQDGCAVLPNVILNEKDVYNTYFWRKIYKLNDFNKYVESHKWSHNVSDYVNIIPKYPFKLKQSDFNKKRVTLVKKGIKGLSNDNNFISGFTNRKELKFKDELFEIKFDYFSYDGSNGAMALILFDGDQAIPVLSNNESKVGYDAPNGTRRGGRDEPFTTVEKIYGNYNGSDFKCNDTTKDPIGCVETTKNRKGGGWLAISFYNDKITITGSINHKFEDSSGNNVSGNHQELTSISHTFRYTENPFSRFKVRIDNREKGKSLLTLSREAIQSNGGNILGSNEVLLTDFNLMTKGQRPVPEKIKIAFSAAGFANKANQYKTQEIGNIVACPNKINEGNFKVVERKFVEFYEKNKDKTINGVKYDFNWLWNSPLRTKIAGGATKKPYDTDKSHIGYEYCVISIDDGGKTMSSPKDVYVTYSKAKRDEKSIDELLKLKDGEQPAPNYENHKKLTKNDIYVENNFKTGGVTSACFTLSSEFTRKNLTTHMSFNVYEKGAENPNDKGKKAASNNEFAIRPAGFYAEFVPEKFENFNLVSDDKNSKNEYPKENYLNNTIDTNDTHHINFPLKDINSTAFLSSGQIYKAEIFPVGLKISEKTSKGKEAIYKFTLDKTNYYHVFDTNRANLIALVKGLNCSDINNTTLGKVANFGTKDEKARLIFRNGEINYREHHANLEELIKVDFNGKKTSIPSGENLYLRYDNVMKFMIDANDTDWTYINHKNISNFKNLQKIQQDELKQNLQKYGYQCIGKTLEGVKANTEFDDELVSCRTEFINPNLIKFIPPKVAVNFSNIINQSKFGDEKNAKGGFTYINDLTKTGSQKDMSTKVQMIIHPTSDDNKSFSNFTNKCYADDINLTIDYIGDKNLIFDKNGTLLDKNLVDEIDKNFKNDKEFGKYIYDKKKFMHNQDELNKPTDKINATKTHTGNITFELYKFYKDDADKYITENKRRFCPYKKDNEKEIYLCKDINISNTAKEGYNAETFKRKKNSDGTDWKFKDPINLSINIPKNFFNDDMKYYDKDFNINKLDIGKTAVMLGVNFDRNSTERQNPIALFERDFMATNAKISDTDINATNIYPKHDPANAGMLFYGYTTALDAEGSAGGFDHGVSYVVYCNNVAGHLDCKNDIEFLRKKDVFPQTSDVFVNSEHNSKNGEISKYTPKNGNAKDPETKISATNGKDIIRLEAKDKTNLPKTDTIKMKVPSFLEFNPFFKVTFLGEGGRWFGHGGVIDDSGIYRQGEGSVLGTDDGKFKAPIKPKRKIEW